MAKVGVVGAGSWGTALALVLNKNGHEVTLWSSREEKAKELGFENVRWIQTGCVITTHSGPGSFGIVGFLK